MNQFSCKHVSLLVQIDWNQWSHLKRFRIVRIVRIVENIRTDTVGHLLSTNWAGEVTSRCVRAPASASLPAPRLSGFIFHFDLLTAEAVTPPSPLQLSSRETFFPETHCGFVQILEENMIFLRIPRRGN